MDTQAQSQDNLSNDSAKSIKSHVQIVDGAPLHVPSCSFNEDLDYISLMTQDIDRILSLNDNASNKAVTFLELPQEVEYTVSNNVEESDLQKPAKLFPLEIAVSVTAQEMLESSDTLKSAVAKALVTPRPDHSVSSSNSMTLITLSDLEAESMDSGDSVDEPSPKTEKLIELYIQQDLSMNDPVHFDKVALTASNQKTVLMSSKALTSGIHEWTIEITQIDVDLQEIGVIGTSDIDLIPVSDLGAVDTAAFQSRALYGSGLASDSLFYGSFNADNSSRCTRDLRPFFKRGWTVGSLITVKVNMETFKIKFLINGKKARRTMSLEPNKEYFPIICFSGNCQYARHY